MIKGRFVIQLFVIATVLGLQAAPAATPEETSAPESKAPNAQTLGIMESALKYCANIDTASADRLREMVKQLTDGANEEQLAQARQSDEYRGTYDSVTQVTSQIEPPNAKEFCASAAAVFRSPSDRAGAAHRQRSR
jgi:hypothetical protein